MPIVEAKCLGRAFDHKTTRYYVPGVVADYDTDNDQLNSLTTPGGDWLFQYPGHEGKVPKLEAKSKLPEPAKEPPKEDKRYKPMSAEHKKKMADARALRKAKREEMAAA